MIDDDEHEMWKRNIEREKDEAEKRYAEHLRKVEAFYNRGKVDEPKVPVMVKLVYMMLGALLLSALLGR